MDRNVVLGMASSLDMVLVVVNILSSYVRFTPMLEL